MLNPSSIKVINRFIAKPGVDSACFPKENMRGSGESVSSHGSFLQKDLQCQSLLNTILSFTKVPSIIFKTLLHYVSCLNIRNYHSN